MNCITAAQKIASLAAMPRRQARASAVLAVTLLCSGYSSANEAEPAPVQQATIKQQAVSQPAQRRNQPLLIESRVTGSQQQPNVIYVMPWQGIDNAVAITPTPLLISLPQLQPIHPSRFQQQIRQHAQGGGQR
ncbi:hypothetical protein [uncultured Ferrimonas sp.]|uniref:hypothetical protein n=1 Tax=uncultured Ferrimonas sp. TaxID=432640 RepID=UPI0026183F74|nr:hypothetical protein [uncultured Ferrimonas sp.]